MLDKSYILQLATAYAMWAVRNASDYSKEYWKNVVKELIEIRKEEGKMKECDITDVIGRAIENKIGKEWRHEILMLGESSEHVNFVIDGKEYVIVLHEIKDGHNFSEYLRI